jgi:hypothetical protein
LRFAWVPATKSPEDFHLQANAHAGRTSRTARGRDPRAVIVCPASSNRAGRYP